MRRLAVMEAICAVKRLTAVGCLLASMLISVLWSAAAVAQNLTVADVEKIVSAAAQEASARGMPATITVVDRVGNSLAVFQMNGAPARVSVTSNRGIVAGNGLEKIEEIFAAFFAAANSPSGRLSAIAKAITGAYLSSGGNAFTTRTASQIIQQHFNPGEFYSPSGPLFGVQFTQLPCSDLSVRQATNATITGLVSATAGPKRSPLGLSADAGGLPLYKDGVPVGGIGVEADGIYTLDAAVNNYDRDVDEIIALAGQTGYTPPRDILANRIFVEGKSLRYTDVSASSLTTNPAAAPAFATISGGVLGSLADVTGYYVASSGILAGQTFGSVESGIAPASVVSPGVYDFVNGTVFVLTDGTSTARFPPIDSLNPTTAGGGLTSAEVTQIVGSALNIAFASRAQIRRPLNSFVQVTVSVVDTDGNILAIARTPDGPLFGTDTSLQKARTAGFFSSATAGAYLQSYDSPLGPVVGQNALGVRLEDFLDNVRAFVGAGALSDGIAFSDRSGGNLSRPFYPDGIDFVANGPFSKPFSVWSPFNTGLQLDTLVDNIAMNILYADGLGGTDTNATCSFFPTTTSSGNFKTRIANGFQIFPGSVPIYRGSQLVGGIGVSGDGIDQDDMVSFLGLHNAGLALGTGIGNAPAEIRADNLAPGGARLRYVNCPFRPFLGSRTQNVCNGK